MNTVWTNTPVPLKLRLTTSMRDQGGTTNINSLSSLSLTPLLSICFPWSRLTKTFDSGRGLPFSTIYSIYRRLSNESLFRRTHWPVVRRLSNLSKFLFFFQSHKSVFVRVPNSHTHQRVSTPEDPSKGRKIQTRSRWLPLQFLSLPSLSFIGPLRRQRLPLSCTTFGYEGRYFILPTEAPTSVLGASG